MMTGRLLLPFALGACVVWAAVLWCAPGGGRAWAQARNPTGVALIIGNGDYEHRDVPDVKYAHRDAEAFKRYVVEVLGFDPENVIEVRDATRRAMYDALGTKRDVRSDLWSYLDPEGGSEVVVFYSGHGVPGEKDKRGYLLPVDADPKAAEADGYPIDLMYANLGKLTEAKTVRVYVDACFSGGSHEGGLIRDASPVYVKPELPSGAGEKVTSLTAATGKQIASWDAQARHGLFTHHLLEALYGKGDADGNGEVTAGEAKAYLDRWMTRAARRKHKRIQEASLLGVEGAVLTTALEGGEYPKRGVLGGGSGAAQTVSKPALGRGSRHRPESAASPESTFPRKRGSRGGEPAGSVHAVVEAGLGMEREGKVLVQRGLGLMKYDVGYADGLFGKKTRGAIRAWQEVKGFEGTGYLTAEQAEALKAVGEEVKVAVGIHRKPKETAKKDWKAGEVFRDCAKCPEMVVVPAGAYMMGSRSGEGDGDEGPRHGVKIGEGLAVGKYEVTFEEWDACVAGGGCGGYRPGDAGWGRARRPVVDVSWEDAKAYVRWLGEKTGKGYRLLSEAEWEYVARAGTTGAYHWGEGIGHGRANCDGCGSRWDKEETAPVGSFRANGFGLHDVHGNVWEWVEDCWHGNYEGAPVDGSAWVSGGDCEVRVLRGGSWFIEPRFLRSAYRSWNSPGFRFNYFGFRIARTLTP